LLLAASTVQRLYLECVELMLFQTQLAHDVFHDDDCAINDETEIDRAQTHQISRNAEARHPVMAKSGGAVATISAARRLRAEPAHHHDQHCAFE
jgi:hypothetical protein